MNKKEIEIWIKLLLSILHLFTLLIFYILVCFTYLDNGAFMMQFKILLTFYIPLVMFVSVIWLIVHIYYYYKRTDELNNIVSWSSQTAFLNSYCIGVFITDSILFILLIYLYHNFINISALILYHDYFKYTYLLIFCSIQLLCCNYLNVRCFAILYKLLTIKKK